MADTQLFRGLVLVDITPHVDMEGGRRIIAFMSAHPDGYPDLETAAESIGAYRGGRGTPSPSGLTRVLRQGEDGRLVMLVRGGSSDVVTVEAAQALLRMIPHARYVDVADATHMVAGDRNDAFATAVLEFAEPLLRAARGG